MPMRELDRIGWDWILFEDEDGGLVLCVVVSWIGVFEHLHRLSPEEVERYKEQGRSYLSQVSSRVNGEQIAAARARLANRH